VSDERTTDPGAGWLEEFRPSPSEHAHYAGAARRNGLEIAHWARQTLNRAARSILDLEPAEESAGGLNFEEVFQAAPSPMLLLGADDPSYTVLAANDAYLRATMTRREAILGRGVFAAGHDSDRAALRLLRGSLERVIHYRRSDTVRKDDGPLPWGSVNTPLLDGSGRVTGIIHRLDDLAELRAREELQRFLADSTALLAESLDLRETLGRVARLSIPVFADWCILDLFGTNRRIERTAVAHADPADAALAQLVRNYRADLYANPHYPATRVLLHGAPVLIESLEPHLARAVSHDDQHLEMIEAAAVRSVICVALAAQGRTLGFLTFLTTRSGRTYSARDVEVAQDIARRCALAIENARLFEEARSALRVRDDFLSVASHELRTPLTPLQLQIDALERRFADFVKSGKEAWLEERLGSIRRQTDRLEHLVEELREMSHIVEGSVHLQPEPLDLASLIRAAVQRFRDDNPGEEIALELSDELVGRWDRERLGQVLANLLSNAHRHGGGRRIGLRAWREGGEVVVAVSDQRPGLAPRDHRRFAGGGERELGHNYGGLGVALFVTRQILDAMGGTIEASSSGPGATFTVRLPIDRFAAAGAAGTSAALH
jgi:signal transduction histidine kinase/PAS domain-containing protein